MEGFIDPDTGRPMIDLNAKIRKIRCLIDTGSTGYITMWSDLADELKLIRRPQIHWTGLADQSQAPYRTAPCEVEWFGVYRLVDAQVFMHKGSGVIDAVIGSGSLTPYILVVDFNHGRVSIRDPALILTPP